MTRRVLTEGAMNRIKGKLILITGASSGIGAACARRFAAEGAKLVLWARRVDRLEQLSAELREGHGTSVLLAQVDVRDRAAVNAAAASLVAGGTIPDVLLNNAAHARRHRGRDRVRRQPARAREHPRHGHRPHGAAERVRGGPQRVVTAGVAGGPQRRAGDAPEPGAALRG